MTQGRSWLGWLGGAGAVALLAILVLGSPGSQPDGDAGTTEGSEPARREAGARPLADGGAAVASPGASSEPAPVKASSEKPPARQVQAGSASPARRRAPETPRRQRQFDEDKLTELGVNSADVAWLREHYDRAEAERSKLRALAEEEGRRLTPEERDALWQYEGELEQELGSEAYDQLLYASGDPNRAHVRWVSTNSAAEAAGLMEGDIILRYDGSTVYRHDQLQSWLEASPSGTPVAIEYQRGGELHASQFVPSRGARHIPGVDGLSVAPLRVEP